MLYNFTGAADSSSPGSLVIDKQGILYGVTEGNGSESSIETVFSLKAPSELGNPWTMAVLSTFTGNPNEMNPLVLAYRSGQRIALYGTTAGGPGQVYSVESAGVEGGLWTTKVLYTFGAAPDGTLPYGELALGEGGKLYGETEFGGTADGGTVFVVAPPAAVGEPWTETVLASLFETDSLKEPMSGVIFANGILYGTAYRSGQGPGGIFSLTPPTAPGGLWKLRDEFFFNVTDGAQPEGPLVWQDGVFYGTTVHASGTIFSFVL